jgi:hypothetical protein
LDNLIHQITNQYNEALSKLDYFILGATLAICAYLAQTNPYGKLGLNKETMLMGTLLIFAASAVAGFKRIENGVFTLGMNARILAHPDATFRQKKIDEMRSDRKAQRLYRLRNALLLLGLTSYLAVKVWAAYP